MSRKKYSAMWEDWGTSIEDADAALIECDHVFVYGSLKTGKWNNSLMSMCAYVSEDETDTSYILGDVGYPYAFPLSSVPEKYRRFMMPVRGELWYVYDPASLVDLDLLEGHPVHYKREIIRLKSGEKAWMYIQYDWSLADNCNTCNIVEGAWQWD